MELNVIKICFFKVFHSFFLLHLLLQGKRREERKKLILLTPLYFEIKFKNPQIKKNKIKKNKPGYFCNMMRKLLICVLITFFWGVVCFVLSLSILSIKKGK